MDQKFPEMSNYCKENNAKGLVEYIEAGVDVNEPVQLHEDWLVYCSPLSIAAVYNSVDCLKILLENGADVNARDWPADANGNGNTPLIDAVEEESVESVKILLEYNADIHIRNRYGFDPLFTAIKYDSIECLKLLLNVKGADVNATTDAYGSESTLLHEIATNIPGGSYGILGEDPPNPHTDEERMEIIFFFIGLWCGLYHSRSIQKNFFTLYRR